MRPLYFCFAFLTLSSSSPLSTITTNLSKAKAFTLVVRLTNPLIDLSPSISQATFSPLQYGAWANTFTIVPPNPSTPSPRLIQNAPLSNITNTTFIYAPLPDFPRSITVGGMRGDGLEHVMRLEKGYIIGMGVFEDWIDYPRLSGPGSQGKIGGYVACVRNIPYRVVVALFVFQGDVFPEGCVGIDILPVCAELGEGGEGMEVSCFADVEGL